MARPVDIDKILEQVIAKARSGTSRVFTSERTYADEPIIQRGSQMVGYVPQKVKEMRDLQRTPHGRTWSEPHLFFEQAQLMADYEDSCPYGGQCLTYYPTYRSLNDRQLRGYFTWRTHVRAGNVEPAPVAFAFLYIYELLMDIGAEPGEKCFHTIEKFAEAWREHDSVLDGYLKQWLIDYAITHDLDASLVRKYANTTHDEAIGVLAAAEEAALLAAPPKGSRRRPTDFGALSAERAHELAQAVCELSSYRLAESRFYKECPDDLERVLLACWNRLVLHFRGSRTSGLTETLFGTRFPIRHTMFAAAVHYETEPHADATYELSPTRTYVCRNGLWTSMAFHDGGSRSAKLGQIARVVDRELRAATGDKHPLKDHGEPKYMAKIAATEAAEWLAWKDAHKAVRVEIDLSKLDGIRATAAVTREALLVDEEREEVPVAAAAEAPAVPSSPNSPLSTEPSGKEPHDELGLVADENELLAALLAGRSYDGPGNVDLLVDSINEKMFDLVGDTVIEFGADGPELIEDYIDDVREAVGPTQ